MNQSVAIKHAPESSTSGQSYNRVISLSKIRTHQRAVRRHRINMIKQRLMGLGLLIICVVLTVLSKDITAAIIISPIAFMMIFSKQYVMLFKNKENIKCQ